MRTLYRSSTVSAFVILLATAFAILSQPAVSNAFTEGKTIRLLVFATPGGGYDYYSRIVMRHIPKYLPGNPKILVQNMPIGYLAANTLWRSKPDGITWGVLGREGYLNNMQVRKHNSSISAKAFPLAAPQMKIR